MNAKKNNKSTVVVDREVIEDKTKEILSERLGIEIENIDPTFSLKEDLDLDSFDTLRLIFEVEEAFNIKVPPKEISGIKTLGDAINYICKRITLLSD